MKSFILITALISITAQGAVNTKISRIENHEIFAANGRVYEVDEASTHLMHDLEQARDAGTDVALDIENDERITAVELQNEVSQLFSEIQGEIDPMTNFEPSNVSSLELAKEMFKKLKDRTKMFTQCFNRAHIWARQMDLDYGVKSQKILIYYTKKYRAEVDGKWWFHIAPLITVNAEKYVMDKEFTNAPTTYENWEKIFTKKMKVKGVGPADYRCGVIKNISTYYQANNPDYCNIQFTSMYYWEPNDMENLEAKGVQKTHWLNWELRVAAKGFLKDWRKVFAQYKVIE